jgi:hypothetical protein
MAQTGFEGWTADDWAALETQHNLNESANATFGQWTADDWSALETQYDAANAAKAAEDAANARAQMRGVSVGQSQDLDRRLAAADAAQKAAMAKAGPGASGKIGFDAAMKAFGPIDPWIGQAMANERNATGGDPVPASDANSRTARAGITYDINGQTMTAQFPPTWNGITQSIFTEATQDPAHKDSGQYIPNPNLLPRGASQHSDGLEELGAIISGQATTEKVLPYAGMIAGTMIAPGVGTALGGGIGSLLAKGSELNRGAGKTISAEGTGAGLDGSGGGVVTSGGGAGGTGPGGSSALTVGGPITDPFVKAMLGRADGINRAAPEVGRQGPTGVTQFDAATIAEIERANAGTMNAANISPIERARIAQINGVSDAYAQDIDAANIDPTERATWERAQAANIDPAAMANAAYINRDDQAAIRARQLSILKQLEDAANGNAPSVAQLMLRRASDENISQQQGLAASARGPMVGLAAMNAATNIGNLNQKAALDQAILRAQEMSTARGQYGDASSAVRGQDIGLETSQAGFVNATNLANQGAYNTRALSQAQLQQQAALANQATGAQSSQFNAGQGNARAISQAQLTQDAAKANQASQLQTSLANARARNDAATKNAELAQNAYLADASAANARALQQAQLEQQAAVENLKTQTQVNLANASAYNTRATNQAGLTQDASKANAAALNTGSLTDAQIAKDIALANQKATLDARGIDDAAAANMRNVAMTKYGTDTGAATSKYGTDVNSATAKYGIDKGVIMNTADNDAKTKGGYVTAAASVLPLAYDAYKTYAAKSGAGSPQVTTGGAGAGGGGGDTLIDPYTTSDKRAKTGIKDADRDIADFLDAMSETGEQSFSYRDPKRDGDGKRYGKMAQDLERSDVGRSMVHEDGGRKVVDNAAAMGAMLASLAQVNGRLRKLESRKAR